MEMEEKAAQKLGAFNVFLLNMHNKKMGLIKPYCYDFIPTRRKRLKLWLIHQIFCRFWLPPHEFMHDIDDQHFPQYTFEAIKAEFERRQAAKRKAEQEAGSSSTESMC